MPHDLSVSASAAFDSLAQDNPLRQLCGEDRAHLYGLLLLYDDAVSKPRARELFSDLERAHKVLDDAARLAERLESGVFRGPLSAAMKPFLAGYQDIPIRLAMLSKQLGNALNATTGKRGHKQELTATAFLLQASEFVRLKTGQHYDEHLAELFQGVGEWSLSEDLSGNAIRKKRSYLRQHQPAAYGSVLRMAERRAESTVSNSAHKVDEF